MQHFQGTVWRHIPAGAHPLHAGRILHALGRWNYSGKFGCLYTSLTIAGAKAEYYKHFSVTGSRPAARARRELVSIVVDVGPLLDLTDVDVASMLQITKVDICSDTDESLDLCRSIAAWAREQGYRAILAPSAALEGATNLMLYFEGPAWQLHLDIGHERIPLVP